MIKELFINNTRVDIQDVNIIRKYTSPYFSDATKLINNGTLTVNLPMTINNCSIFGYSNREDMFSDIPYVMLTANYYVNGLPIFENAQTHMLAVSDTFEVQFTWGISRTKYLPLFTKKLNEVIPNGTTILESDWVVNRNKADMFALGKKYKYIDYVSSEITRDVETISGVVQTPIVPDEPYVSNQKEMTLHPFITANDVLDLIAVENGFNPDEFLPLKNELTGVGLILGGNKETKKYSLTNHRDSCVVAPGSSAIPMPSAGIDTNNVVITTGSTGNSFYFNPFTLGLDNVVLNITVSIYVNDLLTGIDLKEFGNGFTTTTMPVIYKETRPDPVGNYLYQFTLSITNSSSIKGHWFQIFINGHTYSALGIWNYDITFDYTLLNSIFGFNSLLGQYGKGRYNCLLNLPDITEIEFIQQMLILTGKSIGYDSNGNFKFYELKQVANNLSTGNVMDWSSRISLIQKGHFQFNSNCQVNWFKFNNSTSTPYINKDSVNVRDITLKSEQDLYTIKFDLAAKSSTGQSEFILYKETVKQSKSGTPEVVTKSFDCSFTEKPSVLVSNVLGTAYNELVLPNDSTLTIKKISIYGYGLDGCAKFDGLNNSNNIIGTSKLLNPGDNVKVNGHDCYIVAINYETGIVYVSSSDFISGQLNSLTFDTSTTFQEQGFISKYYSTYKKIINRPITKTVEVNLDFFESANLDMAKPIYIKEWGKYCILLDVTCPDNEVSVANLLLINDQL